MPSRSIVLLLTATLAGLTGCSYLKYPDVHKMTIRQGNLLNQDMIDQLRPGLNRSQVRYILGTPLIADTFDQSRWDYYYSIKRPGKEELRERVSIYFTDDKLSHFSGDYLPSSIAASLKADQKGAPTDANQEDVLPAAELETFSIEPPELEVID